MVKPHVQTIVENKFKTISNCIVCKKDFISYKYKGQKFCSHKCYSIDRSNINRRTGVYKNCLVCNKNFYIQKYRENITFCCSKSCASKIRKTKEIKSIISKCLVCGKEIKIPPYKIGKKFYCSSKCQSSVYPHLKSTKYIQIKVDNKYIPYHRYLMEQHLGRKLNRAEVVHHKDFNKLNNSLENLEVLNRKDHAILHKKEISKYLANIKDRLNYSALKMTH